MEAIGSAGPPPRPLPTEVRLDVVMADATGAATISQSSASTAMAKPTMKATSMASADPIGTASR
eukprot:12888870-Prorocentrum_lima.AAC.1